MKIENDQSALIVRTARSWLGTPYFHQASSKGSGCDCLGLIRGIWREVLGREPQHIPAYVSTWADTDRSERLLKSTRYHFDELQRGAMQPGHLLIFRIRRYSAAKHMGILSTPTSFIHAYQGNGVVENSLSSFWSDRIVGTFRFPNFIESKN